jgi:hypothetical protein
VLRKLLDMPKANCLCTKTLLFKVTEAEHALLKDRARAEAISLATMLRRGVGLPPAYRTHLSNR